jgi:hypothetical protein
LKTIKITVEAKTTIPLAKLEPFQDEIKTLPKEEYERMRANILKYGFSFAVHVWKDKGKNYIIDGHQRTFTLRQLETIEGYEIPPIPVAIVQAKSFKEAKQKVLAGASQYGRMSEQGLFDFMKSNAIQFELLAGHFDFPEINLGQFSDTFFKTIGEQLPPPDAPTDPNGIRSSSDQVKQVQLLFNAEGYSEFMTKAETLAKHYKTENLTDTVLEALRADHKAKTSKLK